MVYKSKEAPGEGTPQIGLFLSGLAAIVFFGITLGLGPNHSDLRYWIESSRSILSLEWVYIFVYLILDGKSLIILLGKKYSQYVKLMFLWSVIVFLSTFMSPFYRPNNPLVMIRLSETFTHILFFIALWGSIKRYPIRLRYIYLAIISASAISAGYIIYLGISSPELLTHGNTVLTRSDQVPINTLVRRLGYQFEVSIVLLLVFFSHKSMQIVIFLLATFVSLLICLGGRASILGTLLATFIYVYLQKKDRLFSHFHFFLKALPPILIALFLVYIACDDTAYFSKSLSHSLNSTTLDRFSTGRFSVWSLVLEQMRGHWLLGTGPQSYFFYPDRDSRVIHAHNFLLQFVGEWGILGAGLAMIAIIWAVKYGSKIHRTLTVSEKKIHLGGGLLIVALVVTGLFGGIFFFAQTCAYLALAFAVWCGFGRYHSTTIDFS